MKRKGFTLVELLIVVAIIGVLATMMTLTVQDQTPKAQAAKIVSDFQVLRSAVPLYILTSKDDDPTDTYFNNHSPDFVGGSLGKYTVTKGGDGTWTAEYTGVLSTTVKAALMTDSKDMRMTGVAAKGVKMRVY